MTKIELAPFNNTFIGFGGKSTDSGVGVVHGNSLNPDRREVVKWNRKNIASAKDTLATCQYIQRAVELYKAALGDEFIIPTEVAMGAKNDSGTIKYKAYIFQPFIDGWTAKDLPPELAQEPAILDQWNLLNSRLFHLFNSARFINGQQGEESEAVFPIGLTVGSSRSYAFTGEVNAPLPKTPNLLIDCKTFQLGVCDFGKYEIWKDSMWPTYNEILNRVKR